MHLGANELARLEAMMEHGQVFSAPEHPCPTDRMLDLLRARARVRAPAAPGPAAAPPRAARRSADWLDLPSLEELLQMRRALLQRGPAPGSALAEWPPSPQEG